MAPLLVSWPLYQRDPRFQGWPLEAPLAFTVLPPCQSVVFNLWKDLWSLKFLKTLNCSRLGQIDDLHLFWNTNQFTIQWIMHHLSCLERDVYSLFLKKGSKNVLYFQSIFWKYFYCRYNTGFLNDIYLHPLVKNVNAILFCRF